MIESLIRAMLIMIFAAMNYLNALPDGMALNPFAYEFCPELYCPTPTSRQHRRVTLEPTVEATPEPTPTEEPWACPILGDSTKKEYKDLCMESCKDSGLTGCGRVCGDCWESE